MPHSLTHPERLTITGPQGETYQGGDQEWYRDLCCLLYTSDAADE